MSLPFPEPTAPRASRAEVFVGYREYFRCVVVDRLDGLPDEQLRTSRLPSGWAPLEVLVHLIHVERRRLVWGFEGEPVRRAVGGPARRALARAARDDARGARGRARARRRRPWSGCCSTCCRSTPATRGTSTSSAS